MSTPTQPTPASLSRRGLGPPVRIKYRSREDAHRYQLTGHVLKSKRRHLRAIHLVDGDGRLRDVIAIVHSGEWLMAEAAPPDRT